MLNISLRAENIFKIGTFPVTNSGLLTLIAVVLLVVISITIYHKISIVPGGMQNIAELIIEGALGLMDGVLGSRNRSETYLPLVLTVFLFILFSNWLGLLPGVGSILVVHNGASVPLFRSPASDLNFTLALALIAVVVINAISVATVGLKSRASVFFNFKNPLQFFVGILELVSEFAKIISFSFRLFGNVFAGEVLLVIMAFLVPYLVPVPFMLLEVFVGFIQAFVFAMLILAFIAIGTSHGDNHDLHSIKIVGNE